MTPTQAIIKCYANFLTFSGRASASEFWWFFLYQILCAFAFGILYVFSDMFPSIYMIDKSVLISWGLNALPFLSVLIRRLHDRDWSGWWVSLIILGGAATLIAPINESNWIATLILVAITLAVLILPVGLLCVCALPTRRDKNQYGKPTTYKK